MWYEPEATDSWWVKHGDIVKLILVFLAIYGMIAWGIAYP